MKLTELLPLKENSNLRQYMASPSAGNNRDETFIQLVLTRKWDTSKTAWYRLETDGWFRRQWNPGKGHGIMFRGIKIKNTPKYERTVVLYPMTCYYLPNEFDHPTDDIKANWEHAYGYIIIGADTKPYFEDDVSIKGLETFINNNIKKYKP